MTVAEMKTAMTAAILEVPAVCGDKRWISEVWASQEELLTAARMGVVELGRCDLAGAYDAAKQEASEMRYLNGTFHFVRLV